MKIAILTLRVDNNYGGHLQRYALSRVLQDMGHDACVLYFRSTWNNDSTKKRLKKAVKNTIKKLLGKKANPILYWKHEEISWEETRKNAFPFFQKYINHSELIYDLQSLKRHVRKANYDALIVGSDQVWRKAYTERWGVDRFFLDFASENTKRITYAASFGKFDMEYTIDEKDRLSKLYEKFDAVSVREISALDVLKKHNWSKPKPIWVLDPTMLLTKEHYLKLIKEGKTTASNGNMFCYILDRTEETNQLIDTISKSKQLKPFYSSIHTNNAERLSVEQWLRSFDDSEYIITDSYHGVVFALIFNKPFYLVENNNRGNARFDSLKQIFNISTVNENVDWDMINKIINNHKKKSLEFLSSNL